MEQSGCAQCTQDKQDGSDFSHLQESFEPVGFDNHIAVFSGAVLESFYIKRLPENMKVISGQCKKTIFCAFFSIDSCERKCGSRVWEVFK